MKSNYRVYYENTDAGGVVYHGQYIHFCERARLDYWMEMGMSCKDLADERGILFVVRALNASYNKPGHLEDILTVDTEVETVKNASIIMKQNVYCEDALLFEMEIVLVCIDKETEKPMRVPDDLRPIFLKMKKDAES